MHSRMKKIIKRHLAAVLLCLLCGATALPAETLLSLRQEYNAVAARIDSLVRLMELVDPEALDAKRLPPGNETQPVPEGMSVVAIFWADDEARVWLNGYLVGETRLSPVEIEVPSLYLQNDNRIRARCWDTDWVESGFLFGLYLKSAEGGLHPIVVSDETWRTETGPAREITYAHPVPDIPNASVIWQTAVFGIVEFERDFDLQDIRRAAAEAKAPAAPPDTRKNRMDYHSFIQSLAILQERRAELGRRLGAQPPPDLPTYEGTDPVSLSLTLGKAGPLHEDVSRPMAEEVKTWAQNLPEAQQRLIYPEKRGLKGEEAANPASGQETPVDAETGERQREYRPPEERSTAPPGEAEGREGKGNEGRPGAGIPVEGSGEGGSGFGGIGGGADARASRLGLLLPTAILALYVGYIISKWNEL